jgi:hypothetical protein
MSDSNTPVPQGPTQTHSDTAQPAKGRQPDYDVHQVLGEGDKSQWMKIGAVWEGKDGYLSGNTVHGKIVLQSREAKETLQQMRVEKQTEAPAPQHTQNPSQ